MPGCLAILVVGLVLGVLWAAGEATVKMIIAMPHWLSLPLVGLFAVLVLSGIIQGARKKSDASSTAILCAVIMLIFLLIPGGIYGLLHRSGAGDSSGPSNDWSTRECNLTGSSNLRGK